MLLAILGAVMVLIPSIGFQTDVQPVEMPANLVFEGSFERLDELQPWDAVSLDKDDSTSLAYVVAWSRLYPTGVLPPEVYDGPASGGQVLTLITDAPSDESVGYPQQRVVRAVPMP